MDSLLDTTLFYSNQLNTYQFSHMLDDPTQCYKFYWLDAIVNLTATANTEEDLLFDDIINEMICDAWISVTRYHLKLGPTILGKTENYLEHAIRIIEKSGIVSQAGTKAEVLTAITQKQQELRNDKYCIARHVPYRRISPFLGLGGDDKIWNQHHQIIKHIETINKTTTLPYVVLDGKRMKKRIRIDKNWRQFIIDNYQVISSWVHFKKIRYLQDRNPGVPGIIYKLSSESELIRKLANARILWKTASTLGLVKLRDIYTDGYLSIDAFDLDHFIPWSYIANDELWNLIPMSRSLNSSKNNRLPDWERYYRKMSQIQYELYEAVFISPIIRDRCEACRKDNLNAIWATELLYVEGNSKEQFSQILEHNLKPIYDSARLQGFGVWRVPNTVSQGNEAYE